ncbi:hypothetical protein L7F22_001131 [Adiantum nelumboides]|nr:hypothetical protein [Adiantum nelumboides]
MEHSQGGGSARWVNAGFFVLLLNLCICWTIQAGEQHQVGGPPGWSLPDRSKVNYTEWSSTQTFMTGDTLYFNYSSAYHNVLEVTKVSYENCDASKPTAKWADGKDVIPLNSSGTFYYICGISGHCEAGQKVAVDVVSATQGVQHQVGGSPGWSLPSMANVNYTIWASQQKFVVGDSLYFNYSSQYHNVLQVTEANYDACNASQPIRMWDDGATVIPLNMTGTFYYICGIPGHCEQGQKVAVTVGTGSATSGAAGRLDRLHPWLLRLRVTPMSRTPSLVSCPSLSSSLVYTQQFTSN